MAKLTKEEFLKRNPEPGAYGSARNEFKVTTQVIKDTIELRNMGYPLNLIAREYGVSYEYLKRLCRRSKNES